MIISRLCSLHVLLLCGRWVLSATDSAVTDSTISSQTHGGSFGSPSPAPGVTGVTVYPTTDTVTPSPTTHRTPMSTQGYPEICLCDLTPGFCDIGCCCDTVDCEVANLTTVFTGCPKADVKQVCIEKWLMFRANVDSSLVTVTDTLFCVQAEAAAAAAALASLPDAAAAASPSLPAAAEPQCSPVATQLPEPVDVYHFSSQVYTTPVYKRHFHQVDDLIQTFWSNFSVRGLLHQPAPGAASSFCFNLNPAKFLRSTSLSCTRMVTSQSCTTDPDLSSSSYYFNMSLIAVSKSR